MSDVRIVELALGRIFRMMSRPAQPGDVAEYERCRCLVLDNLPPSSMLDHYEPCYVRDRLKGAQGD